MEMSITGKIKETKIFGPSLELKRTISGTLGKPFIRIHDEVVNRGNMPVPHMLLYHFNFGWPLVDEGTEMIWKGDWKSSNPNSKIFKEGNNFRRCPAPMDEHSGSGEDVAFIDVTANENGMCEAGLYNHSLEFGVTIRFPKKQLPWLTNWQHWGKGEYVVGLEPGTNPPIGQTKAREQNQLRQIVQDETFSYDLEIEVIHQK
jgi:hypothetical protein